MSGIFQACVENNDDVDDNDQDGHDQDEDEDEDDVVDENLLSVFVVVHECVDNSKGGGGEPL